MDNTDNSPEEEKAIKKKKEDDSNVILNMLVVNKKAKLKACAGFQKHQTYTGLHLHHAYCRCGRYGYTCLCI